MCRREAPPLLVRTPRLAVLLQAAPIRLRAVLLLRARIVRLVRLRRFPAVRLRRQELPLRPLLRLQRGGRGKGLGLCYDLLKQRWTVLCVLIKSCRSFGREGCLWEKNLLYCRGEKCGLAFELRFGSFF